MSSNCAPVLTTCPLFNELAISFAAWFFGRGFFTLGSFFKLILDRGVERMHDQGVDDILGQTGNLIETLQTAIAWHLIKCPIISIGAQFDGTFTNSQSCSDFN
ncbi:MAG: hypothetical protein H7Z39_04205 [Burkholderiaceae bacterium]|nr:hypothetical protein [Burkholderiaceae bacterium]